MELEICNCMEYGLYDDGQANHHGLAEQAFWVCRGGCICVASEVGRSYCM